MINPRLLFSCLMTVHSTALIFSLTTPPHAQANQVTNSSSQTPVSLRVSDFINIEIRPDRRQRRGTIFERRGNDFDSGWRSNNDFDSGRDFDGGRDFDFDR